MMLTIIILTVNNKINVVIKNVVMLKAAVAVLPNLVNLMKTVFILQVIMQYVELNSHWPHETSYQDSW